MWPTLVALGLNSVPQHHGPFAGILCSGIMGGALVPFVIGWLGDRYGLRSGMLFLYLTFGFVLSVGVWAGSAALAAAILALWRVRFRYGIPCTLRLLNVRRHCAATLSAGVLQKKPHAGHRWP